MKKTICSLALSAALSLSTLPADACTRILYETGTKSYMVGRSMDWMVDPNTDLWAFPKGMARDGGVPQEAIKWTAKHGSVISSFYNLATVDGMNDAGLVANVLYLVEADYGDATKSKKPKLSIGAWAQYALDNFGTVAEAVTALQKEPFVLVAPDLPDGHKAGAHLAIADATGDSAIFEYLNGKLVIHHSPQYRVMTNSPSYDQQLAINAYWNTVGGLEFLPGTARASDRFARISWNLNAAAKESDPRLATAATFSLIRAISVPLGITDPKEPNIASTVWRTVSDVAAKRYYFESAYNPAIFWVDLEKVLPATGGKPMKLDLSGRPMLSDEVSEKFVAAEPFKFISH
ncbi:linear amide C-N hydrolase [Methylocystis parvus]|uniref:Linear amide C-N hydrolase n=1 Tax=Methylocystis parvus TaxID=134 RepID=A0A6B8M179_9HYPH|nr:linear amide C-N hydrolase [Methylocystis parvus]QGM96621.1 linear amide C-N hydrolase [Methylocystis parvus]WBJ99523.1 linear amide C-N hydrolase [Methylocystis parvus OBBP]